jgi:16S rRNA G966 N2-methylase RsmD
MTYFSTNSQDAGFPDSTGIGSRRIGSPAFEAQSRGASSFWDVEHSCRALEPIEDWVKAYQGVEEHGLVF